MVVKAVFLSLTVWQQLEMEMVEEEEEQKEEEEEEEEEELEEQEEDLEESELYPSSSSSPPLATATTEKQSQQLLHRLLVRTLMSTVPEMLSSFSSCSSSCVLTSSLLSSACWRSGTKGEKHDSRDEKQWEDWEGRGEGAGTGHSKGKEASERSVGAATEKECTSSLSSSTSSELGRCSGSSKDEQEEKKGEARCCRAPRCWNHTELATEATLLSSLSHISSLPWVSRDTDGEVQASWVVAAHVTTFGKGEEMLGQRTFSSS